jgi:hypothetical protein
VKLYPIRFGPNDAKFYLAFDSGEEMLQADVGDSKDSRGRWGARTRRFDEAICDALGLEGNDRRFVRANYESDGIFVAKLFGPALDRLGETAKMLPGQIGHDFLAWGVNGLFAMEAMAAILEKPLVEAMLGRKEATA